MIAGADRTLLLTLAHALQALAGLAFLVVAFVLIRRRVPASLQRAIWWGSVWVSLRCTPQELITPDLLLCTCVVAYFATTSVPGLRWQLFRGLLAGTAFLMKTSIWPWLLVATVLTAWPALRHRGFARLPWTLFATAFVVSCPWIAVLSIRAGHPTLGSVGPLNASWYLGDRERRMPDTDTGPHERYRMATLPDGNTAVFADLRDLKTTYAPWSDPEMWARGVPVDAQPVLSLDGALKSWRENAMVALYWVVPFMAFLAVLLSVTRRRRATASLSAWVQSHPAFVVGVCAAATFLAVHAEPRLLAPAFLICLFAAFMDSPAPEPDAHTAIISWLVSVGVLIHLSVNGTDRINDWTSNEPRYSALHAALARASRPDRSTGIIVIGPASHWLGTLWQNHARVAIQFGARGEGPLDALPEQVRERWLRAQFAESTAGFGRAKVTTRDGKTNIEQELAGW